MIAVSAEPMFLAPITAEAWGMPFEVIGDPTHKLLHVLRKKAGLKVVITGYEGDEGYDTNYYRSHKTMGRYKHGCAQPAIVMMRKSTDDVVFRWAVVPKLMNLGGASDRPKIPELWTKVKVALDEGGEVTGKVKLSSKFDRPEFRKVKIKDQE